MSDGAQQVTPTELRRCMAEFATGVTVVTTVDEHSRPVGTTANAITSLSLDPPLIVVSLANTSRTLARILGAGRFAVNILTADQAHLCAAFAVSGSDEGWLACDVLPETSGIPLIAGSAAWLRCRVHCVYPGGDHKILVGLVDAARCNDERRDPLVFVRGAYA